MSADDSAPVHAIGLISGTSADAIDAVLIHSDGRTRPRLLAALERPFPDEVRRDILALQNPGPGELDRMGALDQTLGGLFADAALAVCAQGKIHPKAVRVIGSHGQTVRHRPRKFTLQIGNPFVIAARTGITTVADFRPADMARGGEGAPLAPFFHHCLFAEPGRRVAVVNLGGIANVTALPVQPSDPLIAGDTGPASSLLDLLAAQVSQGRAACDRDGAWAARGRIDPAALAWLREHPYLAQPFPKSTGREAFGKDLLDRLLIAFPGLSDPDRFATLTEFTVGTVADACRLLLPPAPERLILCGGGGKNRFLVERLGHALPGCAIHDSSHFGVDADSLEAQAFAWFAVRTLRGDPSSAPSVTGASEAAVLGAIFPGTNRPSDNP